MKFAKTELHPYGWADGVGLFFGAGLPGAGAGLPGAGACFAGAVFAAGE